MLLNRRSLLKQLGCGLAGIGVSQLVSAAAPQQSRRVNQQYMADSPIRLSSNENPYGPGPLARAALAEGIAWSNRYNWDIASQLITDIAQKNAVTDDNVLLGAGSTELLDTVAGVAVPGKESYVIADPSYHYWTATLSRKGAEKIKVPLTADKKIDLPAMRRAIRKDTRLVYICNPNNPTGTVCDKQALLDFVKSMPANIYVIIDEAYLEYTNQSSMTTAINQYPNLVVVKTFSKLYGLAGARMGYALACKATIEQLSGMQSSPNSGIAVSSRLAAIASLTDADFLSDCYSRNEAARRFTMDELERLVCTCIPSATNFIYFSLANYKNDFFARLKEHNIEGTGIYEEQGKWTRITIGTMEEMERFIAALQ